MALHRRGLCEKNSNIKQASVSFIFYIYLKLLTVKEKNQHCNDETPTKNNVNVRRLQDKSGVIVF